MSIAQFMRTPVGSVDARNMPPGKMFFIMPTVHRTMATLAIEDIILARTFIRPDEYVQSVHYHIRYTATKASCLSDYRKGLLDADIQISQRTQVMNMRRGELRESDQASSDLLHCNGCIFVLLIIQLDPWL